MSRSGLLVGAKRMASRMADRAGTAVLAPPRTAFGRSVNHGPRDGRKVALTFDDGPSRPSTETMLDVLDRLAVPGTFFCVGEMAAWYPEVLQRAVAAGHVIGNHSVEHSRRTATAWSDDDHIDRATTLIRAAIGRSPALYRPPWGWLTPWEARRVRRRGMTVIGWDAYPDDWLDPEQSAEATCAQIVDNAQPGSIILLHDATSNVRECTKVESARAVELAVGAMHEQGYEFVTVPELLGIDGYRPDQPGTMAC